MAIRKILLPLQLTAAAATFSMAGHGSRNCGART